MTFNTAPRLHQLASISLLAFAGALLSACGGGSGSEAVTAAPASGNSGAAPAAASTGSTASPASTGTTSTTDTASTSGSTSAASTAAAAGIVLDESAVATQDFATSVKTTVQSTDVPSLALAATAKIGKTKVADGISLYYYVSPNGNDTWSGKLSAANAAKTDGPFKTLTAAQTAARTSLAAMKAGTLARTAIHVAIEPGTYSLTSTFTLSPSDSGIAGSPMVYEAVTPGTVILSGGAILKQKSVTTTQAVFAPPAGYTVDWGAAQQLYVNGRRAVLARQPNAGTNYFITKAIALPGEVAPNVGVAAFGSSTDAVSWVNGLSASDKSRAVVNIYNSWTTGRHRIATTAPAGALQVSPAAYWPFLSVGTSQRYYVENVKAALDAPAEWYGDSTGVTYLKQADEANATLQAIMPVLDQVVAVKGNASAALWVQYVELRGLRIENSRFQTPPGGYLDGQSAANVDAALDVDAARFITIDDCRFAHTGGYGMWLRAFVRNSTVTNNVMADLGAGGIKIGTVAQSPTDPNASGNALVSGNTVTDDGHIMPGAVGIWIGQGFGNTVTKNLVANTTYTGISVGWEWGYGAAAAGNNNVSNNMLFNIGMGTLADLGGIYSVGVQPGTSISGNLIREVRSYSGYGPLAGAGAWGMYEDEGVSNTNTYNNVVVGTDSGAFHLHYGRDNTVQNNLFAWGNTAEFRLTTSDPLNTQLHTAGNLFVPLSSNPFDAFATSPDVLYSGNAVAPIYTTGATADITMCGTGCSRDSASLATTAYPKGVTLTNGTAAISAMVATTLANAGPDNSVLAQQPVVSMTEPVSSVAPPLTFDLDLADTAIGTVPVGMVYGFGNNTSSMSTIAMTGAASNGKCLKFADTSTFLNKWEPYANAVLNHATGTSVATFQLWVDSNTNFIHEWRDNAVPYNVGPTLNISSAGIVNNGKVLMPITLNSWNTFTVTAGLADKAGTWSLTVTDSNGASRTVSNIANMSTSFKTLNWLGFISNANVTTTACLGSLDVVNQ